MSPKRVQMSRQKPWRAENPDAVIVARPSYLGNPFAIYEHCKGVNGDWGVHDTGRFKKSLGHGWTKLGAIQFAVDCYRQAFDKAFPQGTSVREAILRSLRGRDLACWCPLDQPCHCDVLLELANPASTESSNQQKGES